MNATHHRLSQNRVETFRWNVSTPSGKRAIAFTKSILQKIVEMQRTTSLQHYGLLNGGHRLNHQI
ncbi:hypothetical protein [Phormidesmis priestleyi]|uniref:hypothetical protein n=1 Tax=Phormidesmis priestleyi TaxID=268141 RepID=UPI0012E81462|nr:hypothetical protein [Phormidesmis priestleyi]